ncbi:MAG: hypothetical protein Fues2KO_26170 [Fuerstiella sp.]
MWFKLESQEARVDVGRDSFIGRLCEIDCTERVSIGDGVLLAPGVFITDHNHRIARTTEIRLQGCASAPVVIEDDVWVGANAIILPGVRISKGAVIGAGAVVTKNVPAYEVWAGVPAQKKSDRE